MIFYGDTVSNNTCVSTNHTRKICNYMMKQFSKK